MDKHFSDFLLEEMSKRGWSQADLARASGLNRQVISSYINLRRANPEPEPLLAIAKALKVNPVIVFRSAGIKLPSPDKDPWVEEMAHKISLLSPSVRSIAERLINSLAEGEEREQQRAKPKPKTKSSMP